MRLASWRSRVAPAAVGDGDARRRQDLLARKRAVEGELEAVSARLGLWTAHAGERSLEALEKLDARMAEVIPRLRERQGALQRELKTLSSVLVSLPRVTESGQLVIPAAGRHAGREGPRALCLHAGQQRLGSRL